MDEDDAAPTPSRLLGVIRRSSLPRSRGGGDGPPSPGRRPHVVVVGGGIAGMAAAAELVDWGCPVTLVEKRPFLGGRAFSFTDGQTGLQVDNGQHVFLGCCHYYIRFLKKLGTLEKTHFQTTLDVPVMDRSGRVGRLREWPLPAPFHLLPALVSYPHLGWREKLLALYALVRVRLTDRSKPDLESQTFSQWLRGHGQGERALAHLWNLLVLPALNDSVEEVSASLGLMVFQEGVLAGRHSANVGYPTVGLSQLMGDAAADYIRDGGGTLLLGKSVSRLLCDGPRVTGVELAGGEVVRGEAYVSALPHEILARVLPEDVMGQEPLRRITALSYSPIVNLHIWYDRPVMEGDFVAVLDSPLQWVFNKSRILGAGGTGPPQGDSGGQCLCLSISGAWEYIHQPKEALERTFLAAVAEAFPRAAGARVEKVVIVKQEQATFRCLPGSAAWRPGVETPLENLFLAGEWTDTGWPSTMEGAVRSGLRAARAAVDGE